MMVGRGDLCALTDLTADKFVRYDVFHQVGAPERVLEMGRFTQVARTYPFAPFDTSDGVSYGGSNSVIISQVTRLEKTVATRPKETSGTGNHYG